MFYEIIIFLLFVYSLVLSVLYFNDLKEKDNFQRSRLNDIILKEEELKRRESIVVDKEICFRELTKLKTVQNSIFDMLSREGKTDYHKFDNMPSQ